MLRLTLVSCFLAFTVTSASVSDFNVVWSTPTPEPGHTAAGRATYEGAMPLGNGAMTILAWPNISNGGVDLYVGHQKAMSSWTELFKISHVHVSLSPNPFSMGGSFFQQELDFLTATMTVYAGGTSNTSFAAKFSVWVDANSDSFFYDVTSGSAATQRFSMSVKMESVRPIDTWTYTPPFGPCHSVTSQPDVFLSTIPPAAAFAPQRDAFHPFHHATGAERPMRKLKRLSRGAFLNGSIVMYHRNMDSDGLTVPDVLGIQGCAHLVNSTPDHWRDLQFGVVIDNGLRPPSMLERKGPNTLMSSDPAVSFQVRGTVLVVQTDSRRTGSMIYPLLLKPQSQTHSLSTKSFGHCFGIVRTFIRMPLSLGA